MSLPRPALPRGMACSWIGDGTSNPAPLSPSSTSGANINPEKVVFSWIITSPVRAFCSNFWEKDQKLVSVVYSFIELSLKKSILTDMQLKVLLAASMICAYCQKHL